LLLQRFITAKCGTTMKLISICNSSCVECETIATVGFFDGVHRGHRYLIDQLKTLAQKSGLKTAIVTFPVHPRKILQQDYQPKLLNTLEERIAQLSSLEIDFCYLIDFSLSLSEMSAEDFIQQKLRKQLRIKELLIGYDHKFGKGRTDGYEQYAEYGAACGMIMHKAKKWQNEGRPISSTLIRHLLAEGNVQSAANALTYRYSLEGQVVEGDQLGRTLNFPTANLFLCDPDKMVPCNGVYAVFGILEGKRYAGMAYIGKRPTVAIRMENRVEVHLFHFDKDIYGKKIRIEFVDFLRSDRRFNSLADLQAQLIKDRADAQKILEKSA